MIKLDFRKVKAGTIIVATKTNSRYIVITKKRGNVLVLGTFYRHNILGLDTQTIHTTAWMEHAKFKHCAVEMY